MIWLPRRQNVLFEVVRVEIVRYCEGLRALGSTSSVESVAVVFIFP
jgi:hypothetical protein